jgi:4-hydroxy-3-polyprenylbenzoate decarboxylase
MKRIAVGITGASGVIYGVRILEVLSHLGIEVHLIITQAGLKNLQIETSYNITRLKSMASHVYDEGDLSAPLASGSFKVDGMVVAPCSIKTLSAIANSYSHNLVVRAADVTLKERRRLVLLVRETPLHEGHLELMLRASRTGAILLPPMPAFYFHPKTIDDLINHMVGKVLDLFGIDHHLFRRWGSTATKKRLKAR